MTERRRAYRINTELPATCFYVQPTGILGESFDGVVRDVSSGGVALTTRADLRTLVRIYLEFWLGDLEVAVDGVVVRREQRPDGRFYGVKFLNLDPAAKAVITKLVFAEARRQAEATSAEPAEETSAEPAPVGA